MNATYITYNGVFSAIYGLKMNTFDGNDASSETTFYSSNISVSKSKTMKRYYITNIDQDNPLEKDISLISDNIIHDINKREILAWLTSGHDFVKMIIHRPEMEEFYYMCKFKEVSEIKVNGVCVGFKMKVVFNSPYQYGAETKLVLNNGNYTDKLVSITNKSDINDDFVHPVLKFKLNSGSTIKIINMTDDENRVFEIINLPINKEIIIDNELKIISGDGVFLSNFNKNWLRLKKGKNNLKITFDGELNITCPQIMCIGF